MPCYTGSAVILAGGQGRRIGCDKKELVLAGEKIIDRLIRLLSAHFDEIIVSTNTAFERTGIICVEDTLGAGPLAGIYSALQCAASEYLYVTACDMPFISCAYIDQLAGCIATRSYDVAAARRPGGFIEPFNAFYRKTTLPLIREQLLRGEYKMGALLYKLEVCTLDLPNEREFFNINYQTDLSQAEELVHGHCNDN
ncbi:MAG: molybdenum cofactor guanylyltransferase [Spirochaetaceae bacterium]|nr:molybdenum cofactor guanylyltransferase [Spirochaetaceae bacterium]